MTMWDVFICHASEDKEACARPLANRLEALGVKVWLDEAVLRVGDSIRKGVDQGLAQSRYGVVILSPAFFSKTWTQAELGGLISRESVESQIILPVWHRLSARDVRDRSPLLADRVAARWEDGIDTVVARILEVVRPSGRTDVSLTSAGPTLRALLPHLRILGPCDHAYNSFAWAAGDTHRWWYPDLIAFWPSTVERVATLGTIVRAFETLGYRVCMDSTAEGGHEKIVVHADESGTPTHVARQVASGKWTSKLGSMELVEYDTADLLTPLYGKAVLFLKRPTSGAAQQPVAADGTSRRR